MKFLLIFAALVICALHWQQAKRPLLIVIVALGAGLVLCLANLCVEPLIYKALGGLREGGAWVSWFLRAWRAVSGFGWSLIVCGLVAAVLSDRGIRWIGADALRRGTEKAR